MNKQLSFPQIFRFTTQFTSFSSCDYACSVVANSNLKYQLVKNVNRGYQFRQKTVITKDVEEARKSLTRNHFSKRKSFFRTQISSSLEVLDSLHQIHSWIPSSTSIRPPPEKITMKHEDLLELSKDWKSMDDYILHHIFDFPSERDPDSNKLFINQDTHPVSLNLKKFQQNQYPYQGLSSYHYVMWFSRKTKPYQEEVGKEESSRMITRDIEEELLKLLPQQYHPTFQFVWYENPKMTVPQFYHVHVFWIEK
jgi:hypothetical protein